MRKPRSLVLISLIAGLAMVAAACGGDDDEAGPGPSPDAPEEGIYLMGADGLLSDTYVEDIPETEGMYFSGPGTPEGGAYGEFVAAYEEEFGEAPIQAFHAHAYDAANLLFNAIEEVAEDGGGGATTINRQALREAVYTQELDGLTGSLACDAVGDCADPAIDVVQNTEEQGTIDEVRANVVFTFEGDKVAVEADPDYGSVSGDVTVGSGDPIEIATLQAISGDVASLGVDQVRAVQLAIADRGEVAGHPVELSMEEDDQCSPEGGTTGARRIAANEQIVGVIGTSCSGAGVAASAILSEAGVVMISGSNTSPALTSLNGEVGTDFHPGYARTAHNDEVQGAAAATFAFEELGVTQAASINDGDPYTQGLTSVFDGAFEELGGEIVVSTAVGADDTDMRPVLTEIDAAGAQLIYFPIFQPAGDFIARQAYEVFPEVITETFSG